MSEFRLKSVFELECRDRLLDGIRSAMEVLTWEHDEEAKSKAACVLEGSTLSELQETLATLVSQNCSLGVGCSRGATIHDILDELLKSAGSDAIGSIRFYRYCSDGDDRSYLLVDSAGYDETTANRLRSRGVVLFQSSCPLECSDTFWSERLRVPVVVTVNQCASTHLEPRYYPGCLPLISIPHDDCEETLGAVKSTTWIDVPLMVCGEPTGKLSCDFKFAASSLKDHQNDIMHFAAQAQIVAPFLEVLCQRAFLEPLNDVIEVIQSCKTLTELFDYCTEALPVLFSALNASVFVLSRDSFGARKLVLEKTSFTKAQCEERYFAYSLEDDALTAWVARNNRSLRVHDLADDRERERERQLNQYRVFDGRLNWRDRLTDSTSHSSYLAVPIPVDAGIVGGVIRLTEKGGEDDAHFTERDQWLLERIARDVIGRRLVQLQAARGTDVMAYEHLQDASAVLVSNQIPTTVQIAKATRTALTSLLPSVGNDRRITLNVLTNDCRYYREFELDEKRTSHVDEARLSSIAGSLVGHVIRGFSKAEGEAGLDVIFINDANNAKRRVGIDVAREDVECAIACPIVFRRRMYGALIIESRRYDIFPDSEGRWLAFVAIQAGTMFARRDHAYLTKLKAKANLLPPCELMAWLSALERAFAAPNTAVTEEPLQHVNLRNTLTELAHDTGANRLHVTVPDIDVLTHKPPLVGVMYRALKHLSVNATPNEPVRIRGEVKDKWLELTVEEFFKEADPLDGTSWEAEDTDSIFACSEFDTAECDTFAWSKKLAYFAQINSKRGSVKKVNSDFVVRFPAG